MRLLGFERRIQALDAVPTIVALQDRVEKIRHGELNDCEANSAS